LWSGIISLHEGRCGQQVGGVQATGKRHNGQQYKSRRLAMDAGAVGRSFTQDDLL
jgi:hypothetical protein